MNLSSSAALQARSIFALMMRRIRSRYSGSRAGYLWAIIEPLAWVFVLKLAFQNGNSRPPVGDSFEVFFATGVVVARTWRSLAQSTAASLIKGPRSTLPTIHRMDGVYANWALETLTGGIVLIIILSLLQLFGFEAAPGHLFMCIVAFLGMSVFALAFGLAFALLVAIVPAMTHFRAMLFLLLFVTSGFSFVVDRMPPNIRNVLVWNPVLHCVEWFRESFYAGYECQSLDLLYLFSFTIICLLLGLAGERAFRRQAGKHNTSYADNEDF